MNVWVRWDGLVSRDMWYWWSQTQILSVIHVGCDVVQRLAFGSEMINIHVGFGTGLLGMWLLQGIGDMSVMKFDEWVLIMEGHLYKNPAHIYGPSVIIPYPLPQKYTKNIIKITAQLQTQSTSPGFDYHINITSPHISKHNLNISKCISPPRPPGHLILAVSLQTRSHALSIVSPLQFTTPKCKVIIFILPITLYNDIMSIYPYTTRHTKVALVTCMLHYVIPVIK